MDDFKNSTRTKYDTGSGYAKGGTAKVGKVMTEFGAGKLHSGSKKGPAVTNPKQAMAIALSEARKAGAAIPVKKANGGRAMTEMERRMSEEDVTRGFDTKPPVSRKIQNAKDAAPKREPMIVAKKTTVAVVPKNANPIERLLAVKPGMGLKNGGKPAAYKMGGKVMRKADGGNVNLAGAVDGQPVPAQTQSASQAALQVASNGAPMPTADFLRQQAASNNAPTPTAGTAQHEIAVQRASYDDSQGARPQVSRGPVMGGINKGVFTERAAPTQSLETQRQVSRGPVMGAANSTPTQAVMPSPVLNNRQERMQDRMQERMGRREDQDQRRQGMMDMMDQRRQSRFGPPSTQSNTKLLGPPSTQSVGSGSVGRMSPDMAARLGQANQAVSNAASGASADYMAARPSTTLPTNFVSTAGGRTSSNLSPEALARLKQEDAAVGRASEYKKGGSVKGSKIPVSEKATGETYVSKKAMMKHEKGESASKQRAEKKQLGGLASPIRNAPSWSEKDQSFVADKAIPMREMVGRSNYKKGGKTKC